MKIKYDIVLDIGYDFVYDIELRVHDIVRYIVQIGIRYRYGKIIDIVFDIGFIITNIVYDI